MVKKMKAIDVFVQFVKEYGRLPSRQEFIDLGYNQSTYYRVRNEYKPQEAEANVRRIN